MSCGQLSGGVFQVGNPLACGPGHLELSQSGMVMASTLFTFTCTCTHQHWQALLPYEHKTHNVKAPKGPTDSLHED